MINIESYRSPKTKVGQSKINGKGLFALKLIKKGEIVAIKGGHLVTADQLQRKGRHSDESAMQIAEDFFITSLTEKEYPNITIFLNHSCGPNAGIQGNIVTVAMRDIRPGEEITIDYAMHRDSDDYQFRCNCRAKTCRKLVTGRDWQRKDLQQKYKGYFSTYLERKFAK